MVGDGVNSEIILENKNRLWNIMSRLRDRGKWIWQVQ